MSIRNGRMGFLRIIAIMLTMALCMTTFVPGVVFAGEPDDPPEISGITAEEPEDEDPPLVDEGIPPGENGENEGEGETLDFIYEEEEEEEESGGVITPFAVGDYNAVDISVINGLIDDPNNSLSWPKAPADGNTTSTWMLTNWPGIKWSTSLNNKRITILDIQNRGLTGSLNLTSLASLEDVYVNGNNLSSINVSGLTKLDFLDCGENQITSLDLSGRSTMRVLYCNDNGLQTLNLTGCTSLVFIDCSENALTSLDLHGFTALQTAICSQNLLNSLNVSGCTSLISLECYYNNLTSLDVSNFTALKYLDCNDNLLETLSVSGCSALVYFDCYDNQLTSLDVSGLTMLSDLCCWDNSLEEINVTGCTALEYLEFQYNNMTSLDVSGFTKLEVLLCNNNELTSLDVSGCSALENLKCQFNSLTVLDLSNLNKLEELNCRDNELVTLNITNCGALKTVNCYRNELTTLNITGYVGVEELDCSFNQLSTLNLSNMRSLTELECFSNRLTNLNLFGCTALARLDCSDNRLEALSVSGLTKLAYLDCHNNVFASVAAITGIPPIPTVFEFNPQKDLGIYDNSDIDIALLLVEGAAYPEALPGITSEATVTTLVEGIIGALSLHGVIAAVNVTDYIGPTTGTVGNLAGTNGSYEFTVTLSKGSGTPQTTNPISIVLTATAYDATQDNLDITAAKSLIQGALYTTTQALVSNLPAAKTAVEAVIAGLSLNGVVAEVEGGVFTAAVAGTPSAQGGTPGSYKFTVDLNKGGGTQQTTSELTLWIIATPYDATQDNLDISAAKTLIEGTIFTTTPPEAISNISEAKTKVQTIIGGLSLNGVTTEVIDGSFTAAVPGTPLNKPGADGNYKFTVRLNKGGGTQQTTVTLTLVIKTIPYDNTQDNTDIGVVKGLVEAAEYTAAQINVNNASAAKTAVSTIISGFSLNGVTPTIVDGVYTGADAGTQLDLAGRNGSYTFTVKLNKGGGEEQTTKTLTLTITATLYVLGDNDYIDFARYELEAAVLAGSYFAAAQSGIADISAAKAAAEGIVAGILESHDVDASLTDVSYTAAITGNKFGQLDTPGRYVFNVTLSKGSGTPQTMSGLELTLTATPYNAQDDTDIASAASAVENATYATDQSVVTDITGARDFVEGVISGLSLSGASTAITDVSFTAAISGVPSNMSGTNGSYVFNVAISKGTGTTEVLEGLILTITAIAYDPTQDNLDIDAAKTLIEETEFTADQDDVHDITEANAAASAIIAGLELDDVIPTIIDGDFIGAEAGTQSNTGGKDGSYIFTVKLNKGGGTEKITEELELTIKAAEYIFDDNDDIDYARFDIEAAVKAGNVFVTAQSGIADVNEARVFVEGIIADLIDEYDVRARITDVSYAVAITGDKTGQLDKDGSYVFNVRLTKGSGTPQTMSALILTLTATPYNPQDDTDIASAAYAVENAAYKADQSIVTDITGARDLVEGVISGLSLSGVSTVITDVSFTAAISGTPSNMPGTGGIYVFNVTLSKGTGTPVAVENLILTIVAIAYDPTQDNIDIGAVKTLVEGKTYTAAQTSVSNIAEAKAAVSTIIAGLALNDVIPTVVDGVFTGANAGTQFDLEGEDGSYTFTVKLNKGGGTEQTTIGLKLTITATLYVLGDNDYIDFARYDIEDAVLEGAFITAQSDIADVDAAREFAEGIITGLAAEYGVSASIADVSYIEAITGDKIGNDDEDGSYVFNVTLSKGSGTPQTMSGLILTLTATPYNSEDDDDIDAAMGEIEAAVLEEAFTAGQAEAEDIEAAREAVQAIIDELDLETAYGVTVDLSDGTPEEGDVFTAATTGAWPDVVDGTDGSYIFNVTISKATGTPQTAEGLLLTITAIPYDPAQDTLDIEAAKLLIEEEEYEAPQATARNKTRAQRAVESIIGEIELSGVVVQIIDSTYTDEETMPAFTAAETGTAENTLGVDGSYLFMAKLSKAGGQSLVTDELELLITALPYDPEQDSLDTTEVKGLIEAAVYVTTQPEAGSAEEAKAIVEDVIQDLDLNGVTAVVNTILFTPATAGTAENLEGTGGSYDFIVTLSKGLAPEQNTILLSLKITANIFDIHGVQVFFANDSLSSGEPAAGLFLAVRPKTAVPYEYNLTDYLATTPPGFDFAEYFDISYDVVKNNKVADITAGGALTAKAAGVVTATATLMGKEGGLFEGFELKASATVRVMFALQKVSTQAVEKKLAINKTFTPKITYTPTNATIKSLRWSSDNPAVARVDADTGKVTAVSPGVTLVTLRVEPYMTDANAADEDKSGYFERSYRLFVPTGNLDVAVLRAGGSERITGQTLNMVPPTWDDTTGTEDVFYTALSFNAMINGGFVGNGDEEISWKSSNTNIAAVDFDIAGDNGKVTVTAGSKVGTATITATARGGKKATFKVKVGAPPVLSIIRSDKLLSPIVLRVGEEEAASIGLEAMSFNGGLNSSKAWKSSNTKIATVTWVEGIPNVATVKAVKAGKVTITATDVKGKTAKITVTVTQPVLNLSITNKKPADNSETNPLVIQRTKSFTAKTKLNTGFAAPSNKTLVWESDNPAVASVSAKGVIKGLSTGDAKITVSSKDNPEAKDSIFVRINVQATKVTLEQSKFTMTLEEAVTLSLFTTPILDQLSDGKEEIKWTVPANKAALLEFDSEANTKELEIAGGILAANKKSDKVKVTATAVGGKKATIEITVAHSAQELVNMRLTKTATWLQRGKSETLKVAMNEGKNPLTNKKYAAPGNKNVLWSIEEYTWDGDKAEPGSVATIDYKGKVTARGFGYAVVTVRAHSAPDDFIRECTVYCSPKL